MSVTRTDSDQLAASTTLYDRDWLDDLARQFNSTRLSNLPATANSTPQPDSPTLGHILTAQLEEEQRAPQPLAFGRDVNYSSRFVLRDMSPGGFLHTLQPPEYEVINRFPGYPRLARLDQLKRARTAETTHGPLFLSWIWQPTFAGLPSLSDVLGHQTFDAILLNVPKGFSVEWLADLRLHEVAAMPSFLFIVVRESTPANLEAARTVMQAWGFRRCEDIVWLKSDFAGHDEEARERGNLFADVKEHFLMGIRGTARRSLDGHLIHCNIDSDLIVSEEFNDQGMTR